MIDLIIDLLFIGSILIVAIPLVAALIAVGATLMIFFSGIIGAIGSVFSFPFYWIVHHNHRK